MQATDADRAEVRRMFTQAMEQSADPDRRAELELLREYFANPDFRARLNDYVWEVNQAHETRRN